MCPLYAKNVIALIFYQFEVVLEGNREKTNFCCLIRNTLMVTKIIFSFNKIFHFIFYVCYFVVLIQIKADLFDRLKSSIGQLTGQF